MLLFPTIHQRKRITLKQVILKMGVTNLINNNIAVSEPFSLLHSFLLELAGRGKHAHHTDIQTPWGISNSNPSDSWYPYQFPRQPLLFVFAIDCWRSQQQKLPCWYFSLRLFPYVVLVFNPVIIYCTCRQQTYTSVTKLIISGYPGICRHSPIRICNKNRCS